MKPRVSITMPVLNGEKYIDMAIGSIAAQSYRDFELIVVDDGSTDRTAEHIQRFAEKMNIKYVRHDVRQGIARSVNDGIRHSSGEFIAFLDHDDAWLPEFLETQVSYLDQHRDVGMVHSDFQTTDSEGNILEDSVARRRQRKKRPSGHVFPELFMDSFIVGNSVLIRRECIDRFGGFDEQLRLGDYHLWMRIAMQYKVDYVDKALTQYRQHATQTTRRDIAVAQPDQDSAGLQAVRKILEVYPEARQSLGDRAIRRRLASLYFDQAYSWFWGGAFRNARICLAKAIRQWPSNSKYYLFYGTSFLPSSLVMALHAGWQLRGAGQRFLWADNANAGAANPSSAPRKAQG